MSGHGACCGNNVFEVAMKLTGENTRLQFEITRLGGELMRLSDENARMRDENNRLSEDVKRLESRLGEELTRLSDENAGMKGEINRLSEEIKGFEHRLGEKLTRLGEELTRPSGENARMRDENNRLAAEVKRLTDAAAAIPPPAPQSPLAVATSPPASAVKKYIYLLDSKGPYSTSSGSNFLLYSKSTELWNRVKTQDGDFLLSSEVSPQGHGYSSGLTFDKKVVDTPGLTFSGEVS